MAAKEQQLFASAGAYYQGAMILMNPPVSLEVPPAFMVPPALTCASLSLKLYLKTLLTLEGKDRDDALYGIVDLYRALDAKTEELILAKFDEFANAKMTREELIGHLESLDRSFIKWRYIQEEDAKSVNIEDLEEMLLAAKAAVLSLKPEWA